jgi:5'(3')-deoxyribonucleotidase
MGFIHETNSEIFGIETRSESAYLRDLSADKKHLHIRYVRKSQVRDEIADSIMKQAGEFFSKGEIDNAMQYKKLSEIVRQTAVSYDEKPYSVEATYEWIKELVKFVSENDILPKSEGE